MSLLPEGILACGGGVMSEICDKCLDFHWYRDDVPEECEGQEEPCHEYSPCMEIRRAGEQNE